MAAHERTARNRARGFTGNRAALSPAELNAGFIHANRGADHVAENQRHAARGLGHFERKYAAQRLVLLQVTPKVEGGRAARERRFVLLTLEVDELHFVVPDAHPLIADRLDDHVDTEQDVALFGLEILLLHFAGFGAVHGQRVVAANGGPRVRRQADLGGGLLLAGEQRRKDDDDAAEQSPTLLWLDHFSVLESCATDRCSRSAGSPI